MGLFDTAQKPDTDLINNWKKSGMLGIRLFLASQAGRAWMTDGSSDWLWPALERNGIPLMIFASGMMPSVAAIAERHPGLKICIDSFGVPAGMNGLAAFSDYDSVLALAKYPNVGLKAESVPFLSGEAYPYTNLHGILRRTFDAFGPQRMFWGSDITLLKTTPYKDAVRAFTEELPWLKGRDLELVMGEALAAWVNWPASA
jgi:predicted TIM-barrel fold metal-dependent hydrolase